MTGDMKTCRLDPVLFDCVYQVVCVSILLCVCIYLIKCVYVGVCVSTATPPCWLLSPFVTFAGQVEVYLNMCVCVCESRHVCVCLSGLLCVGVCWCVFI